MCPNVNEEGTTFAKLTFWEKRGESFVNFAANHARGFYTIKGNITVTPGNTSNFVNISVDSWTFQRDAKDAKSGGSAAPASGGYNSPSAAPSSGGYNRPAAAAAPPSVPDGVSQFADFDDDDGELPF